MRNKKILYVRSGPYKVNLNSYNLQEVGFSKSLCDKGFSCDILYYSNFNKDEEIYSNNNCKVRILWRKGIKILRTGIYPQILNKKFLSRYDLIIATEYSQIMTILMSKLSNNVVIYNGPYYNLFKIKFIEKIYDKLFVNVINKNIKQVFVKSDLAKEYLIKKGIKNISVLGVGLDISKFELDNKPSNKINKLIEFMKKNKCLLYVGSLDDRKNFRFTLKVFEKVNNINPDIKLVVIGKGKRGYVENCFKEIKNETKKNIIHINELDNNYLKFVYKEADIFVLPSKLEIFGMVLLEAMYFGVPTITSVNGGSSTLIKNNINGIIMNNFDENNWCNNILNLINNKDLSEKIKENSKNTIKNNFNWNSISSLFLNNLDLGRK
ncbi:glycosyltransferase [Clostridium perfringens]|uniref:glycosyltransferase family 4 protein n=1 Tax=Clostridium perfringens TaxID=1502 RepID=UPI0028536608|nr:glycosyltransferase family 4 protein [Clostridium perfringens]EJT6340973.1 glycosyltransferase family 4 protein [Clostridium perfringens]EJT6342471.1 glycosyltransferase family 4 protein [Clostridium perfringens]MDK0817284.1 glycosyltransferase family 4 protein [Clostridium perfringens]MDZ5048923.1 glycosyltransferase [Clostridium perfringens]CAJ1609391.1 D-inositol-3-phosphate glycosyltransferase [Clostridium perfringens]